MFKANGEQVFQFHNFHDLTSLRDTQTQVLKNLKCLYMLVSETTSIKKDDVEDIELVFFFSSIVSNDYSVSREYNEVATFVKIKLSEILKESNGSDQPLGTGKSEILYIF